MLFVSLELKYSIWQLLFSSDFDKQLKRSFHFSSKSESSKCNVNHRPCLQSRVFIQPSSSSVIQLSVFLIRLLREFVSCFKFFNLLVSFSFPHSSFTSRSFISLPTLSLQLSTKPFQSSLLDFLSFNFLPPLQPHFQFFFSSVHSITSQNSNHRNFFRKFHNFQLKLHEQSFIKAFVTEAR
jgi:hypothetical protein